MRAAIISEQVRDQLSGESEILGRLGLSVTYSGSLDSMQRELTDLNPDVVVLEGEADEAKLISTCRGIKRYHPRCKIVVVMGEHADSSQEQLVMCGADRFLRTPSTWENLLELTGDLLHIPRRHRVRILGRIRTTLKVEGSDEPVRFGNVVDISLSGLKIQTHTQLEMGSRLSVELFLPGDVESCVLIAEIVRQCSHTEVAGAEFAFGARFIETENGPLEQLAKYIERSQDDDTKKLRMRRVAER